MFKCLVANRFSQESLIYLQNHGNIELHHADLLGELQNYWPECEGLIIRSRTQINKDLLNKLPKLRVIITATSGFDHIDLNACQEKNISIMHTPLANAQSAAELTFTLMLASQKKLLQANQHILTENWRRTALLGEELADKKLGIIGLGRIGQRVYKIAKAFDMSVVVHDPYVTQSEHPDVTFLGYEEVIRSSDIVTFHVPYTTETRHMIKTSTLEWFREDATLINASRGNVVCMNSLLQHLSEHPHFKVALDVFPNEPLPKTSPLLSLSNVVTLTPHIGATTKEALKRASQMACDKLIAYVEKGSSSDTLPPKALWADKIIS